MPYVGRPAPAPEGKKAALWHGNRFSKFGEAAVLAVVLDKKSPLEDQSADWFFGLALKQEVEASNKPLLTYLEAATHIAEDQNNALDGLSIFIPTEHFK
jgi:hypothetical protein